ncbi:MAG: carbohydrate ABC transporter permease [Spirochaetia bacterium]|jgi:raffinose/stachyose/melibiose transport system permease protein|nr:carbohydrate ABC transporter permease [Spirochaetia bacterium]
MKRYNPIPRIVINLLVFFIVLAILVPIVWMYFGGFKTDTILFSSPWAMPQSFSFRNFVVAWNFCIGGNILNSIIYTVIGTAITVLLSSFAAFATVRFSFCLKAQYFVFIISGMMVASQSALIPIYKLLMSIHLYNTRIGLILPYVAYRIPFSFFLLWTYFSVLPIDVEESAYLEGAKIHQIFFKIVFPMSKAALITAIIESSRYIWNDFAFALVFTEDPSLKNIPLGLFALRSTTHTNWTVLLAGLGLSAVPMIVVYLSLQKYFINDVNAGSVKG